MSSTKSIPKSMNYLNAYFRCKSLTLASLFLLTGVLNLTLPVSVQSKQASAIAASPAKTNVLLGQPVGNQLIARKPPTPNSDDGGGRGRRQARKPPIRNNGDGGGKGRRKGGSCEANLTPGLTALVPTYQTSGAASVIEEETLAERPTFWIYVPHELRADRPGELQLLQPDASGNMVYQTVATATGTKAGVIGVQIPPGMTLPENQRTSWRFMVLCDRTDYAKNIFTEADVLRRPKNPTLQKQLRTASPTALVAIYDKQGLWYDVLTALAKQRQAKPGDPKLAASWNELLRQGGLPVFSSKDLTKAP